MAPAGKTHNFGSFPAAEYLSCTGSAKIAGRFGLNVTGVTGTFRRWTSRDHDHQFTASLQLTTAISASVAVSAHTTCNPSRKLEKVAAVKFLMDGVVVEIRPDFYLTISAKGSITVSRSITQSVTLTGRLGSSVPKPSYSISRGNPVITASGSAAFTAVIGGQAEILAGATCHPVSAACPSASSCDAVGFYEDPAYADHPMLLSGSGACWTVTQLPLPANAQELYIRQGTGPFLTCLSASQCLAVGTYTDSSGTGHGLLLTNGTN